MSYEDSLVLGENLTEHEVEVEVEEVSTKPKSGLDFDRRRIDQRLEESRMKKYSQDYDYDYDFDLN